MNCESFKQRLQEISNLIKDSEEGEFHDIFIQISNTEADLPLDCSSTISYTKVSSAYKTLLSTVISSTTVLNRYGQSKATTDVIDQIVLHFLHVDSFFILVGAVKDLPPSSKLDTVIILLEKFLKNGSFVQMLAEQSIVNQDDTKWQTASNPLWEQLVTYIVSLPNRVSDKCLGKTKDTFETGIFSKLMSQSLYHALEHICHRLKENENSSTRFLSILLGRLCLSGFGNSTLENLIPKLLTHMDDFLWQRIIKKLVLGVPEKFTEAVIMSLLFHIPWYGYIECFIGDGLKENVTLKYLISKKLILIHFYDNSDMLLKCIGYLAMSKSRQDIFLTVFRNLLDVWSKSSALKHQSHVQHLYISRGIIICGAFVQSLNIEVEKSVLMDLLLQGVQTHIENSLISVRTQGMVVGEIISSIIYPQGPKLEFEIEETDETRSLYSLLNKPVKPEPSIEQKLMIKSEDVTSNNKIPLSVTKKPENLDSDDDLEPYDQSNDTTFQKERNPVYVQDILDGLIDHSRPEYSNLCLELSEKIIRSQIHYTYSVAEELMKVLLHLEDTFAAKTFVSSRFRAMIAITVIAPEKTAKYLTDQFYDRNYNIRQRLDILEVLAAASQELSQCKTASVHHSETSVKESSITRDHWSVIVQKRIELKTRRFSKGRTKEPLKPVTNRFAPVAGAFFFPLLKYYDKPESTLDLLGEDNYVLGRLIYTLGIICNSSANTIILRQMSKAMLDFIWTLRYHTEVFVRQALLFSLCMIVINVTPSILLGVLQSDLLECQLWLQDILEKDPNLVCQKWAGKILSLIFQMVKNEQETM